MLECVAFTYLLCKHFACDFPIAVQTPWMFTNKGTYGHLGGLTHSSIHLLATLPVFLLFPFNGVLFVSCLLGEFLIHYHMDWFKMWWCSKKGYKAGTHPEFWWWLGIDQLVHGLTYVGIVVCLTS